MPEFCFPNGEKYKFFFYPINALLIVFFLDDAINIDYSWTVLSTEILYFLRRLYNATRLIPRIFAAFDLFPPVEEMAAMSCFFSASLPGWSGCLNLCCCFFRFFNKLSGRWSGVISPLRHNTKACSMTLINSRIFPGQWYSYINASASLFIIETGFPVLIRILFN